MSIFLFVFSVFITGCKKSANFSAEQLDSNFVNLERAKKLAGFQNSVQKKLRSSISKDNVGYDKEIESITPFSKSGNIPTMYVINYKGGGFLVLSADDRFYPILAISENSTFPITDTTFVPGVREWIADFDSNITKVRSSKIKQDHSVEVAWKGLDKAYIKAKGLANRGIEDELGFDPCERDYESNVVPTFTGTEMSTRWDQGNGYNDALSSMSCLYDPDGQPPTGCVATSMAQIMKFREYPTSFSWSLMDNLYPNSYIANLMADIGNKVNMTYACNGSGATMSAARNTFANNYGYSNATLSNFNFGTAINAVASGPILLAGGTHAWVADAHLHYDFYECQREYRTGNLIWVSTGFADALHMNWGWSEHIMGFSFFAILVS